MMSYHVSHTRRGMSFIRPTEMENYIHETIMFMIDLLLGSDTTFIPIKSSFPNEPSSLTRSNNSPSTSHHFSTNNNTGQNNQHYNQHSRYNSSSNGGSGGGGGYHDRKGASGHTQASSEMLKDNHDRSNSSTSIGVIKTSDKHGLSLKDLTRELYNRGGTRPLKKLASGDSVEDRVLNFLWQHPAIFEVVGDHVSLRPMSSDLDHKVEQSLEQRTMDFILFRCKQYGECKIMISKLFGNLKQAANDIQKHFHDYMCFYHFLARHQDVFVFLSDNFVAIRSVYDKYARLRRMLPRCDEYIREPGVLECTDIITDLMTAQDVVNFVLRHRPVVAVDCEGVNLGAPHGDITLVQLAFVDYPYPCDYAYPIDYPHPIPDIRPYIKVFLFDVQADHRILSCYLKLILESPHHTKIFQGCASDARALRMKHNISLRCVFDTTIAHQFLRQDEIKSDLYHLYETYVKDPTNRLKKDIKKLYIGNPGLWTTRPLSELLVYYAAFDVYALLRIHDAMLKELHQHDFGRKFREIMMRSDKLAFGTVREQNMTPHVEYYQSRSIVH